MDYPKKVNVICPNLWEHHRGGWNFCNKAIKSNFHNKNGVLFYTNSILHKIELDSLNEPWIAFMHITKLDKLEEKIKRKNWQKSLPWCKGIYTLCEKNVDYIKSNLKVEVENLIYPCAPTNKHFNLKKFKSNKKIVHIGHWLRRPEMMNYLNTNFKKIILNCKNKNLNLKNCNDKIINYLPEKKYDILLSESLVFIYLIEASANTTILECIIRNTPVLVNYSKESEEYLGKNYPFFYNDMNEASEKIKDLSKIKNTHIYLKKMDKEKFKINYFIKSIAESKIYNSIPKPLFFI